MSKRQNSKEDVAPVRQKLEPAKKRPRSRLREQRTKLRGGGCASKGRNSMRSKTNPGAGCASKRKSSKEEVARAKTKLKAVVARAKSESQRGKDVNPEPSTISKHPDPKP